MSVRIMTRVFEHSKSKGTNRLMLLCIADNANDNGQAFPGMDLLAEKMGKVSRRSAGKRVEALSKTTELGVYPRKGTSHDYIVFTGMTITQAKEAIRALCIKRRKTIADLRGLRIMFAGHVAKPDSQVPANLPAQVPANIPSQEPSVEPSVEPSEPKGLSPTAKPRDEYYDLICTICGLDPSKAPGGQIVKVKKSLGAVGHTLDDLRRFLAYRQSKSMGAVGSLWWLSAEMAKTDWRNGNGRTSQADDMGSPETMERAAEIKAERALHDPVLAAAQAMERRQKEAAHGL